MDNNSQAIQKWLYKQKRKKERFVSFNEALFGKNILAYIIFRLRYFSLNVIFTMCVHVLEFYFLTIIFTGSHLGHLILFRAGIFVVNAGWWGMLEVMRSRIRALHISEQKKLSLELGNWQFLAIILSSCCFIISIGFVFFTINQFGSRYLLENFYIAAVVFQLGAHLFLEVRRAGIYAKFRIRRPILSIIITPLASILFLVIFWWFVGGFTLVLNTLFSAILSFGITLYYINRAYTIHQWPPTIWPSFHEFRDFLPQIFIPEFFLAGFASILISLEGILIWLIYYYSINHGAYNSYYKLFYFISPLLNASSTWGRLFYFDIKKYSNSPLNQFMPSFNTRIFHLTPLIGLFYWLITALFCVSYFQENAYSFSLLLLVFFILRSSMTYLQILAFSKCYYWDVIISSFIILFSVLGFLSIHSLLWQLLILFTVLILGNIYIYTPRLLPLASVSKATDPPSYCAWLNTLIHHQKPTTIISLTIANERSSLSKHRFLMQKILSKLIHTPHYLWLKKNCLLLFFASNEVDLKEFLYKISLETAGIVKHCATISNATNGIHALKHALDENLLLASTSVKKLLESNLILPHNTQSIIKEFKNRFPLGNFYEFNNKKLVVHNAEQILEDANYYGLLVKLVKKALMFPAEINVELFFSVSAYCDNKNNIILFVIPISYENYKSVCEWNLAVFKAAAEQFLLKS